MANPGGAIARHQSQWKQPPLANGDEENNQGERDCCADQVQQTRARLAVFGNIVWPKFVKRFVLSSSHIDCPTNFSLSLLAYPLKPEVDKLKFVGLSLMCRKQLHELFGGNGSDACKFQVFFDVFAVAHANQRGGNCRSRANKLYRCL